MRIKEFLLKNREMIKSLIIGILISAFFYSISITKKEPIFRVNTSKIIIIDYSKIDNTNKLKILADNGDNFTEIKESIYAIQFSFWNAGNSVIKKDEILDRLEIYFNDDNVRILDYKVLKISRDVIKIELLSLSKNQLELKFKILEENDGFTAQIIFTGKPDSELLFKGNIEGVKSTNSKSELFNLFGKSITFRTIFNLLIFLLFILSIVIPDDNYREEKSLFKITKYYLFVLVIIIYFLFNTFYDRDFNTFNIPKTILYNMESKNE